jgi:signal transduction histidine kinase
LCIGGKNWRAYATGAVVFTLAICSMHFTGMAAVIYRPDPSIIVPDTVVEPAVLAIAVAAVAILIVALGLVGALVDSHLSDRAAEEANRLRGHIAELEATQARLEQTSDSLKLALDAADAAAQAKAAFLAAMSHELRTPLNAVIGFSEVLSMETFGAIGSARNKDYVGDIHASGVHLLALINDILDIARIDSGQAQLTEEVVDLKAVTAQALCMVTVEAEANNIALVENIAPEARSVRADQRRMKQVLINLVGNAVKFTNPGGTVTIAAHGGSEGLVIEVSDTGIGIAEKDIPVALSYFGQIDSTLARKYEGTGLGLPLAKQLVELHGGTLSIESAPGRGTKVIVTLPAQRMVAARPQMRPLAATA